MRRPAPPTVLSALHLQFQIPLRDARKTPSRFPGRISAGLGPWWVAIALNALIGGDAE